MGVMNKKGMSMPKPTGLHHYTPRSTDAIVTTFGKSGTTLLQNLIYHLAYLTVIAPDSETPPIETFTDISVVTPWIDYIPEFKNDFPACDPRIFKTHGTFDSFKRFHQNASTTPRHIYVVRSPFSYPPSFLDFLFEEMTGDMPESKDHAVRKAVFHAFVRKRLSDPEVATLDFSWFKHVRDWISPQRPNVLVLFFEDVVRDLDKTTRTIASFMQLDPALVTDGVVDKVVKACDRSAMAADPRFQSWVESKGFGIGAVEKVKEENRENSFKQFAFSDEEKKGIKRNMQEILGYSSYEELKEATKKAQMEKFGK